MIFSRGMGKYDSTPEQREAADFGAFFDAILADRASAKGQQWIAAPFGIAPDDDLHKARFKAAIGKPHRCHACVLPRAWIGLDVDGGLTAESFAALVQVCHRWRGAVYTTASHTPDAPRCRVIVELDQEAPRAELIAASIAMRARIDSAMRDAGQPMPKWDSACDRPEQPLYLPVTQSQVYRLDGEAACLAELLADRPVSASCAPTAPPAREGTLPIAGNAELIQRVLRGDNLHDSTRDLLFRLRKDGVTGQKAVEVVRGVMLAMPSRGDAARWQERYNDLPRMAESVQPDAPPEPLPCIVPLVGFMTRELAPPSFAAPAMPRREVTLLGGHGGSGKSTFALTILAHFASGRAMGGSPIAGGPCAFVSLEDEPDVVLWRLRKIVAHFALDARAVAVNLRVIDGTQGDGALYRELVLFGDRTYSTTPAFKAVAQAVAGCALIVIDNASDAFDGNENERRAVRGFVRTLARLARKNDAAIVLLAHIDKAAAKFGSRDNAYSGSTAWHNSARSRLALIESDGALELVHEKSNYGKKAAPVRLTWTDDGLLELATASAPGADLAQSLLAASDAEGIMAALRAAEAAGVNIPANRFGPNTAQKALETFPELPQALHGPKGRVRFWRALAHLEREKCASPEEYRNAERKVKTRFVPLKSAPVECARKSPIPPAIGAAQGRAPLPVCAHSQTGAELAQTGAPIPCTPEQYKNRRDLAA